MTRWSGAGVVLIRAVALGVALMAAVAAAMVFVQFAASPGRLAPLDWLRAVLIGATMAWLAWGAMQGVIGLTYRERRPPRLPDDAEIRGRTVLLAPICREDARAVFARLAAIDASLAEAGAGAPIDLAVLSDTRDEALAEEEARWFARLASGRRGVERMFYRRRSDNVGRKAGNISDFIARSGGAYDYALVLDADSLMEGETIVEMIRRIEADPGLGLLQTLPRISGARTLFGRALQFSASLHSPIFARGVAAMQGGEGPYWGHNAIMRMRAFAASCHLPRLSGRPPMGGHVLSHDYVEAALLVRGGWRVRLDPDLAGSYEEAPSDLLEYARRERRWCQGNLQYTRLLAAPGLTLWSRFALLQAVLSYLMPVLWLVLLVTAVPAVVWQMEPDYFRSGSPVPMFPTDETAKAVGLLLGVVAALLLPKVLILMKAIALGAAPAFGGALRSATSVLLEIALTSLTAPILLMFQTRAVIEVVRGVDGGWPASPRASESVPLSQAIGATWWIALTGAAGLVITAFWAPAIIPWALPVAGPMIAAPLVVVATSHAVFRGLLQVPHEVAPGGVLLTAEAIADAWDAEPEPVAARPATAPARETEPASL